MANRTDGEKYKYAKLWGVRVVSLEWLRDSVERGMILDEDLYDPLLPVAERGRHAWIRTAEPRTSLGKHARDADPTRDSFRLDGAGRRKLRRTASSKLESQNSAIWNDIVGGGFTTEKQPSPPWDDAPSTTEARLRGAPMSIEINDSTRRPPAPIERGVDGKENQRPDSGAGERRFDKHLSQRGMFHDHVFFLQGFDEKKVITLFWILTMPQD